MTDKHNPCQHSGGTLKDGKTWGGCLLATHEKCAGSKCDDFTRPPPPPAKRNLPCKPGA